MQNELATQLLSELSRPGRRAHRLPPLDVPQQHVDELIPTEHRAEVPVRLPELSEPDVVRHFTNLSTQNMSVDTHFYPLGSCTMKYNPKRNERLASLPGFLDVHPHQPADSIPGLLEVLYQVQQLLAEISGLPAVSLQPAAGAHGELTALLVAAAYFKANGAGRTEVLTADSSHGTNPASARVAGFSTRSVKSGSDGLVDLADLERQLSERTAVFMLTNPNTLGLFDRQVFKIAEMVHQAGGLIYLDGANMNAILGVARPGDFGADLMHFNPHKTFSGPHGGGGPGAGPICVRDYLAPFLPSPVVARRGDAYTLQSAGPESIGRVRSFFGNVGVLVRTWLYIRTLGPEGLRRVSEDAVLSANYLRHRLQRVLTVPHGDLCMHEFVASASQLKKTYGVTAMDLAKRLLDFGFHPPTVYFPLTVPEAMMCEPTETESKETLDAFADCLISLVSQLQPTEEHPLHEAPLTTRISRPDDVSAARKPVVRWTPV